MRTVVGIKQVLRKDGSIRQKTCTQAYIRKRLDRRIARRQGGGGGRHPRRGRNREENELKEYFSKANQHELHQ